MQLERDAQFRPRGLAMGGTSGIACLSEASPLDTPQPLTQWLPHVAVNIAIFSSKFILLSAQLGCLELRPAINTGVFAVWESTMEFVSRLRIIGNTVPLVLWEALSEVVDVVWL